MIHVGNENVVYKGRVFHVQTEERGKEHPFLVSTLFYRGVIICEERLDCRDLGGPDRAREMLDRLKSDFHKRMVGNLKQGLYDDKIRACPAVEEGTGGRELSCGDFLVGLFRTHMVPTIADELGVELSEEEIRAMEGEIPLIEGASEKERFLSLCTSVYSLIKERCDREAFKGLVKRWAAEPRFHPGSRRNGAA